MKRSWRKAVVERGSSFVISGGAFRELMTAVLEKGKPFRFTARGMSMSPFIKDGDLLTVAPFSGERRPRLGDITAVVSVVTGRLLVHRIVRITSENCLIKGDNSPMSDGLFPIDSLLGFVSHLERDRCRTDIRPGMEHTLAAFFSRLGLLSGPVSRINPFRLFSRLKSFHLKT